MSICKEDISAILPNLSVDDVSSVVNKLLDIGVESADDLQHVKESDLVPTVKPIQARKLITAWSQGQSQLDV